MSDQDKNWKINPEWEALEGKPHGVPLCCLPDQYKELNIPPKPEPEDPYDTPEYQTFVEEMAKECKCYPLEVRPCDGLLAGGPCDRMGQDSDFWEVRNREEDDSD